MWNFSFNMTLNLIVEVCMLVFTNKTEGKSIALDPWETSLSRRSKWQQWEGFVRVSQQVHWFRLQLSQNSEMSQNRGTHLQLKERTYISRVFILLSTRNFSGILPLNSKYSCQELYVHIERQPNLVLCNFNQPLLQLVNCHRKLSYKHGK